MTEYGISGNSANLNYLNTIITLSSITATTNLAH